MEIDTLDQLRELLGSQPATLAGVCLQGLDLSNAPDLVGGLAAVDVTGLVVLGGDYPDRLLHILAVGGATVLPAFAGVPFDPYRSRLYRAAELYAGLDGGYPDTLDAVCYRWHVTHRRSRDVAGATFSSIHDTSVTDALDDLLHADRRAPVAVMGGHGMPRGSAGFRAAAELGRQLAIAGALVMTGGGPGAMEAVNLGAAFGGHQRSDLAAAIDRLAKVPGFDDVGAWAEVGLQIAASLEDPQDEQVSSLGIPTWFYGHEPPNVFADRIAKCFSNAVREDILLATATGGVLVLPGAAGTVQEIFQAATRSYYSETPPPPIVLIDREHWADRLPAWQLLERLAAGRGMQSRIALCDDPREAVRLLARAGTPIEPMQ